MKNESDIFFTQDYCSYSAYLQNAKRWKLDFRKLDKGFFKARLSILDIEVVQIVRTQLSGLIDQSGQVQKGYRTFVIPSQNIIDAYWMNVKVQNNSLIVFPKKGSFVAVSHGDFDVFVVSIKDGHLSEIAKECNADNLCKNFGNEERVFKMDEESYSIGQKLLQDIFDEASRNTEAIKDVEFVFNVKYKLPYLIVHFLNRDDLIQIKPMQRKRDKALAVCMQYINENINKNIAVSGLSEISKSSERTVEYAFMERYGISPKTYITNTKLNKIKDVLCDPENNEKVSEVAQRFGFNHMGQFSADYKNLLGELPRETVSNSKS